MSSRAVLSPLKSKEQDVTATDHRETTSATVELIPDKPVLALQELLALRTLPAPGEVLHSLVGSTQGTSWVMELSLYPQEQDYLTSQQVQSVIFLMTLPRTLQEGRVKSSEG